MSWQSCHRFHNYFWKFKCQTKFEIFHSLCSALLNDNGSSIRLTILGEIKRGRFFFSLLSFSKVPLYLLRCLRHFALFLYWLVFCSGFALACLINHTSNYKCLKLYEHFWMSFLESWKVHYCLFVYYIEVFCYKWVFKGKKFTKMQSCI